MHKWTLFPVLSPLPIPIPIPIPLPILIPSPCRGCCESAAGWCCRDPCRALAGSGGRSSAGLAEHPRRVVCMKCHRYHCYRRHCHRHHCHRRHAFVCCRARSSAGQEPQVGARGGRGGRGGGRNTVDVAAFALLGGVHDRQALGVGEDVDVVERQRPVMHVVVMPREHASRCYLPCNTVADVTILRGIAANVKVLLRMKASVLA